MARLDWVSQTGVLVCSTGSIQGKDTTMEPHGGAGDWVLEDTQPIATISEGADVPEPSHPEFLAPLEPAPDGPHSQS